MLATKERGATLRGQFHPNVDAFTFIVHVEFRAVPFAGLTNSQFSHTYLSEAAAIATFNRMQAADIVSHACIIVNAYRDQEFQWEFVPADWRFRR